jgi:hypothetical protein
LIKEVVLYPNGNEVVGFEQLPAETRESIRQWLPREDQARMSRVDSSFHEAWVSAPEAPPALRTIYEQDTLDRLVAAAKPRHAAIAFRPGDGARLVLRDFDGSTATVHGPAPLARVEKSCRVIVADGALVEEHAGENVTTTGTGRIGILWRGDVDCTGQSRVDVIANGGDGEFIRFNVRGAATVGEVRYCYMGSVAENGQLERFWAGDLRLSDNGRVHVVSGGEVLQWGNGHVDLVEGGQVHASESATIGTVVGGQVSLAGTSSVADMAAGTLYATDQAVVRARGGVVYAQEGAHVEAAGDVQVYGPDGGAVPHTVVVTGFDGGPIPETVHVQG